MVQLEAWLGEGPLELTRIFEKRRGDSNSATDFHEAVDGMGRTFAVMQVQAGGSTVKTIGGYNPFSWYIGGGIGTYRNTSLDPDRTAFIFNLTSGLLQRQRLSTDPNASYGASQTFNASYHGPTFGLGDIQVANGFDPDAPASLEYAGYIEQWTYGTCSAVARCENILGQPGNTPAAVLAIESVHH